MVEIMHPIGRVLLERDIEVLMIVGSEWKYKNNRLKLAN